MMRRPKFQESGVRFSSHDCNDVLKNRRPSPVSFVSDEKFEKDGEADLSRRGRRIHGTRLLEIWCSDDPDSIPSGRSSV